MKVPQAIYRMLLMLLVASPAMADYLLGHARLSYLDPERDGRAVTAELYYPFRIRG